MCKIYSSVSQYIYPCTGLKRARREHTKNKKNIYICTNDLRRSISWLANATKLKQIKSAGLPSATVSSFPPSPFYHERTEEAVKGCQTVPLIDFQHPVSVYGQQAKKALKLCINFAEHPSSPAPPRVMSVVAKLQFRLHFLDKPACVFPPLVQ